MSTSSPISPSFPGGPTIFHKGKFLKHTHFIIYKGVMIPHPPLCCLKESAQNFLLVGLTALGCASCSQTSNQTGKLNQIGCKIIRKREKMGGEEGGGPTICHKILLHSKAPNAWPNIPLKLERISLNFLESTARFKVWTSSDSQTSFENSTTKLVR